MPDAEFTRASVLDRANRIRIEYEEIRRNHPYAPSWAMDEDRVRNLCKRVGATDAMGQLEALWRQYKVDLLAAQQQDYFRQEREMARLARAREERDAGRSDLPPWERQRLAWCELQVYLGEGKTAAIDANRVSGGVEHPSRILSLAEPSVADRLMARMVACAREVERELDRARVRWFPEGDREPEDERIVKHTGYTPEQIVRTYPDLKPARIRERRKAMGLDEELGKPVEKAA